MKKEHVPAPGSDVPAKQDVPVSQKEQSTLRYSAYVLLSAFVVFMGAQFLGPTLIAFAVLASGVRSTDLVKFLDNPGMRFLLIFAIEIIAIWGISLLINRRKWTWKEIGLGRKPVWRDVLHGLMTYAVYLAVFIGVYALEQATGLINTEQAQNLGFENTKGLQLIFVFLSLVVLPPIAEEIIFRGYIFKGLRKRLPYLKTALITSVLFGIAHLEFGNGTPLNWAAAIDTFTLSMLLTYATERYKSIWPAMIAHASKNLVAFLLLFIVK